MSATKIFAILLFLYWAIAGIINLLLLEGISLKGVGEFIVYVGLGLACYFGVVAVSGLICRFRREKGNAEISRWWS